MAQTNKVVFGRRKTKGFFDKSIVDVPEQDWIVVDNTHEPIITQEVWDTVHQIMKSRRRENSNGEVQMFGGLVKCSGCGSSLNASYSKPKGKYTGFSCWVYKNYGKERCTSHAIGWVTMNQLVLEDIRRNAKAAKLAKRQYIDMMVAAKSEKQKREIEKSRKELKSVKKRMGDIERILNKLYEDLALDRITEIRYQLMAPQYESELEELRNKEITLTRDGRFRLRFCRFYGPYFRRRNRNAAKVQIFFNKCRFLLGVILRIVFLRQRIDQFIKIVLINLCAAIQDPF